MAIDSLVNMQGLLGGTVSDPYGITKGLQTNLRQQRIPITQSVRDKEFDDALKKQRFGNMLLAFGDILKGKDPSPGVISRQQLIQTKERERKIGDSAANYLRTLGASEAQVKLVQDNPQIGQQILAQKFTQGADLPSSLQEYEYAKKQGYEGSYVDFRQTKSPLVNIDQTDDQFRKSLIELGKEDLKTSRENTQSSRELIPRLQAAQIILQDPDFATGPLTEISLPLVRLYNEITGQDQTKVSAQEFFQAVSSYAIPRMRPPGSGATSDFEANLYGQATLRLGNSKEGNELILGTMLQIANRDQLLLEEKEQYFKDNKGSTVGFEKYLKDNDLVPALYQKIDLQEQNIGEMYDQGKIVPGEVYIDYTDPRKPQLKVFRLQDFQ